MCLLDAKPIEAAASGHLSSDQPTGLQSAGRAPYSRLAEPRPPPAGRSCLRRDRALLRAPGAPGLREPRAWGSLPSPCVTHTHTAWAPRPGQRPRVLNILSGMEAPGRVRPQDAERKGRALFPEQVESRKQLLATSQREPVWVSSARPGQPGRLAAGQDRSSPDGTRGSRACGAVGLRGSAPPGPRPRRAGGGKATGHPCLEVN